MGVCGSSEVVFIPNDDIPGQDSIAVEVFQKLMIAEDEINKFYEAYVDIDADGSGFIRADEFRAYFRIERTPFNDRLFGSFDADGNGFLNFLEFVASIWNFLSTDTREVGNFAFYLLAQKKMVDEDNINSENLKKIFRIIHGENYMRDKMLKKVTDQMLSARPKVKTMSDFLGWCHEHPVLVSPIIRLQLTLREKILGDDFWAGLVHRRYSSANTKNSSYVMDITQKAIKKYEIMAKQIEDDIKSKEKEVERRRRGSVAKLLDRARRVTQRLKKNAKIDTNNEKQEVKKPDHQRCRRSFIRPKLKVKNTGKKTSTIGDTVAAYELPPLKVSKKVHSVPSSALYNLLFSRLVVIDDEYDAGVETVATLRDMGIATDYVQCQVPSDGLLCVENSMRDNQPFEAVFLDGRMPGDNGLAVAQKLRSLGYAGIIIGMCTDTDGIDREEFIKKGVNIILTKPLSQAAVKDTLIELTPVISTLLESRKNRLSRIKL